MNRWVIFICCLFTIAAFADPLGTNFTYQGQLKQSNAVANGAFDFEFRLFDTDAGGIAIAPSPILAEDISVVDGIFTVELDFGVAPFAGDRLWLEISVRSGTSVGGFTSLLPRQELSAVPYALHAEMVAMDAVSGSEILNNSVTSADISANAVGASELADGAVDTAAVQAGAIGGLQLANGAVGSAQVANDSLTASDLAASSVGASEIDNTQVQQRVTGACPVGQYLSGINADGSVVCYLLPVASAQLIDTEANLFSTGVSATVSSNGLPLLVFSSRVTSGLTALHVYACADPVCRSGTLTELDNSSPDNGYGTSVTMGGGGLPLISYYDRDADTLKIYRCGNAECTTGSAETLDNVEDYSPNSARRSSIAIRSNGLPLIAYTQNPLIGDPELVVFDCSTADCAAGTQRILDSVGSVGLYASIAIRSNGRPIISYWDQTDSELGVYDCTTTNCSSGEARRPTVSGPGSSSSLTLGADGLAVISYRRTSGLGILSCTNSACSTSFDRGYDSGASVFGTAIATRQHDEGFTTAYIGDNMLKARTPLLPILVTENPGLADVAMVLRPGDLPLMIYRNTNTGNLMSYACGDPLCLN